MIETKELKLTEIEKNKGQIQGLPANPRTIRDHKFEKLVKSIEENPEMLALRELLVFPHGGKYVVIGGNMRYEALKKLGYKTALCKIIPQETTAEQLKAYTIKDNNGFGEWDFDMLANEWDTVQLEGWGVDLPVWEEEVSEDDFGDEFTLPDGDKDKFGIMNFTVTDEQRERINLALDASVYCEDYNDEDNKNSNGNGLDLIVKQWVLSKMQDIAQDGEETLKKKVEDLRKYLCEALHNSGRKASEVDALLGTNGMSGHYFGQAQWMFPTRDAYEKLKEIMELPRDYFECARLISAYNFVKKIKLAYGTL